EQALHQLVIPRIGMREAQIHELVRRSHQQEVCQCEFQLAGKEDELMRLGVQIYMIIAAQSEDALQIRGQSVGCQEAQKLLYVEVGVDLFLECSIVALMDQFGEGDDT